MGCCHVLCQAVIEMLLSISPFHLFCTPPFLKDKGVTLVCTLKLLFLFNKKTTHGNVFALHIYFFIFSYYCYCIVCPSAPLPNSQQTIPQLVFKNLGSTQMIYFI